MLMQRQRRHTGGAATLARRRAAMVPYRPFIDRQAGRPGRPSSQSAAAAAAASSSRTQRSGALRRSRTTTVPVDLFE